MSITALELDAIEHRATVVGSEANGDAPLDNESPAAKCALVLKLVAELRRTRDERDHLITGCHAVREDLAALISGAEPKSGARGLEDIRDLLAGWSGVWSESPVTSLARTGGSRRVAAMIDGDVAVLLGQLFPDPAAPLIIKYEGVLGDGGIVRWPDSGDMGSWLEQLIADGLVLVKSEVATYMLDDFVPRRATAYVLSTRGREVVRVDPSEAIRYRGGLKMELRS